MSGTAIVIKQTGNSVTFKATSNDVSPTRSAHNGISLHDSIKGSTAFRDAFRPKQEAPKESRGFSSWLAKKEQEEEDAVKAATIIQSSASKEPLHVAHFGLISAIMKAYNTHHNLILRPDDIWQAILTQFSFYVNKFAEELRDCFVDFDGKKQLTIAMGGTLFSADFGTFAKRMVDEQIATNLKDAEVTEWLLPNFSTTTNDDRIAASISIMSTLQSYFEFGCQLLCGIPEVTLEGTPDDWRSLRQKIDKLPQYDLKGGAVPGFMTMWHALLAPVLDEFVASAEGCPNLEFWDKVCSHHGGGSGPRYLSGWVTVFGCFTSEGDWQGRVPDSYPLRHMRMSSFKYEKKWPFLNTSDLPGGAVSVPVSVDDNGTQYKTQMLAGQFAFDLNTTTVRPRTDWCIAYDERQSKRNSCDHKAGEERPLKADA